jgi:hypothetical protein
MMSTNTAPIRDVKIADNLLAGGGYTLYCNAGRLVPGLIVTGNRFSRTYHARGGYFGATTGCESADAFTKNVWDDTGAALASRAGGSLTRSEGGNRRDSPRAIPSA